MGRVGDGALRERLSDGPYLDGCLPPWRNGVSGATIAVMEARDRIDRCASDLFDCAWAFHHAAGGRGSSNAAPVALTRLEEALGALSAGWYEVSADPAARTLSHEQRKLLAGTLQDIAAAFAQCARRCRQARGDLELLNRPPHAVDAIAGSLSTSSGAEAGLAPD